MAEYYRPYIGRIQINHNEMLNPQVVIDGNMALLTYNLVNYIVDNKGVENVGSRWNSTVVYQRSGNRWKTIHSHWSFTMHPAFQGMTAEATEGLNTEK
jgi:ketosteroid isomerase-like protein